MSAAEGQAPARARGPRGRPRWQSGEERATPRRAPRSDRGARSAGRSRRRPRRRVRTLHRDALRLLDPRPKWIHCRDTRPCRQPRTGRSWGCPYSGPHCLLLRELFERLLDTTGQGRERRSHVGHPPQTPDVRHARDDLIRASTVTRQAGPAIVLDRSSASIAKEIAPLLLREDAQAQARRIPPGIYSGSDELQQRRRPSAATDAGLLLLVRCESKLDVAPGYCFGPIAWNESASAVASSCTSSALCRARAPLRGGPAPRREQGRQRTVQERPTPMHSRLGRSGTKARRPRPQLDPW